MASMVANLTQHTRMEALRQLTWLNIHVHADTCTTPIQEQMLNEDLSMLSALQAPPAKESFIDVNTESEHNDRFCQQSGPNECGGLGTW